MKYRITQQKYPPLVRISFVISIVTSHLYIYFSQFTCAQFFLTRELEICLYIVIKQPDQPVLLFLRWHVQGVRNFAITLYNITIAAHKRHKVMVADR
uniref:Uncharacterized protein n=1 Tax=Glossina palpalis gambiensis TaxID=67801 RepID=A0A1B0AMN6_9MUSC